MNRQQEKGKKEKHNTFRNNWQRSTRVLSLQFVTKLLNMISLWVSMFIFNFNLFLIFLNFNANICSIFKTIDLFIFKEDRKYLGSYQFP